MDSTKRSLYLPQDIIEEILLRLAVKSLLRFRCVSKSWRCLIGSERFIKTHLRRSTQDAALAQHRAIFISNTDLTKQCTLQSLLRNGPSIDLNPIEDPLEYEFKNCRVVGCCNGLLCILNCLENMVILWNPATRVYSKLPKVGNICSRLGYVCSKLGFGWDEQDGSHKVFVVVPEDIRMVGKVYSTKTNSWKTVARGDLDVRWIQGKFWHGKLYWLGYGSYIESFDLASEEFGRIKLPFDPKGGFNVWLGDNIGGCLCIVFDDPFDVWVMKESWLKLATIPISYGYLSKSKYSCNNSFGEGPNGEIFLILGHTLMVYNPKVNVLSGPRNVKGLTTCVESQVYVESLVSPALVESS